MKLHVSESEIKPCERAFLAIAWEDLVSIGFGCLLGRRHTFASFCHLDESIYWLIIELSTSVWNLWALFCVFVLTQCHVNNEDNQNKSFFTSASFFFHQCQNILILHENTIHLCEICYSNFRFCAIDRLSSTHVNTSKLIIKCLFVALCYVSIIFFSLFRFLYCFWPILIQWKNTIMMNKN